MLRPREAVGLFGRCQSFDGCHHFALADTRAAELTRADEQTPCLGRYLLNWHHGHRCILGASVGHVSLE